MHKSWFFAVAAGLLLAGCVRVPTGPSVMVLPGSGKSFDQFQLDDAMCRQWALRQTGTTANQAATDATVSGAAVGTVLGAAGGAAIGAASGNPATGAAVGSGVGLLGGTAMGAESGAVAQSSVQRRYDIAYMQCMYAKGNQIPMRGSVQRPPGSTYQRSGAPRDVPPPPVGSPPPPPPGVYP